MPASRRHSIHSLPSRSPHRPALTLLETVIALVLIAVLLSILLPALSSARVTSHKDRCASNLKVIGEAWQTYLADHDREFPYAPLQPAWFYGGMRFSQIDHSAFPDFNRPLTTYLNLHKTRDPDELCVSCPADHGISGAASAAGTAERTAFDSYGTSYRANAPLLDARMTGATQEPRGLRRDEITVPPSALLLCGDPVWYEVAESTGRHADWHETPNAGNMLFLDGSVKFQIIKPRKDPQAIRFDPIVKPVTTHPAASPPG